VRERVRVREANTDSDSTMIPNHAPRAKHGRGTQFERPFQMAHPLHQSVGAICSGVWSGDAIIRNVPDNNIDPLVRKWRPPPVQATDGTPSIRQLVGSCSKMVVEVENFGEETQQVTLLGKAMVPRF
jgi:hypothetical protein